MIRALQLLLEDVVSGLGAAAGGCERLLSTPVPLSYTRHTSRSMMLWLMSLPLAMWPTMGLATVPATAVITFVLIGALYIERLPGWYGFWGPGLNVE